MQVSGLRVVALVVGEGLRCSAFALHRKREVVFSLG